MTDSRPHNPFQWYLGKAVTLQSRSYVVERSEVVGRELSFVLRDQTTCETTRMAPVELLTLVSASQ